MLYSEWKILRWLGLKGVRDNAKSEPFGFLMHGKLNTYAAVDIVKLSVGRLATQLSFRNHDGMITAARVDVDIGVCTGDVDINEAEVFMFYSLVFK